MSGCAELLVLPFVVSGCALQSAVCVFENVSREVRSPVAAAASRSSTCVRAGQTQHAALRMLVSVEARQTVVQMASSPAPLMVTGGGDCLLIELNLQA